jgi:surfactin synthase thioesterase subunit
VRWPAWLDPVAEVLPVQLPGRESRVRERPADDMTTLVAELDRQLEEHLRATHLFYGHSMGALIAYRLARLRQARGRRIPDRLIVGACAAPDASGAGRELSDVELTGRLRAIGGMSAAVAADPQWSTAALALLRDDLRLHASHGGRDVGPLRCPITAFAADTDPLVPVEAVAGWGAHTSAGFTLHVVGGGHFFHHGDDPRFPSLLRTALAGGKERLS